MTGYFSLSSSSFAAEIFADDAAVCPKIVVLDHLDDGECGGGRDRIAAECRKGQAREFVGNLGRRDRPADRDAVGHSLG